MIDKYVSKNKNRIAFTSLGQLRYLSALKFVDIVLGNSSSGLLEAPSFKVATINIGDRQKGRVKAKSVIDCNPVKKDILRSINYSYSKEFQNILKDVKNPYGDGEVSKKIKYVLKKVNLENILKKRFFDIEFSLC
jgi:GDP/UDP-N,N'-diacetylbacillosamine 2-epimerase (hydrolysing)